MDRKSESIRLLAHSIEAVYKDKEHRISSGNKFLEVSIKQANYEELAKSLYERTLDEIVMERCNNIIRAMND